MTSLVGACMARLALATVVWLALGLTTTAQTRGSLTMFLCLRLFARVST